MSMELTRLSVNMNADTAASLRRLATIQAVSQTEIIRRAVALMEFVEDEHRKGRQIITMTRDEKEWRELVLV